jgi:hypothetical protein
LKSDRIKRKKSRLLIQIKASSIAFSVPLPRLDTHAADGGRLDRDIGHPEFADDPGIGGEMPR